MVTIALADDDLLDTLGLLVPAGAGDLAVQRAGSHHLGAGQVGLGLGRAHAPLEVAVARADANLAWLEQARAETDARAASGRQRLGASLEQDLPVSTLLGRLLLEQGCRGDIELHAIGHLGDDAVLGGVPEDLGGGCDVGSTGVRAGDEISLVELDVLRLEILERRGNLDRVGPRHKRRKGGQVQIQRLGIGRAGVRRKRVVDELVDPGVRELPARSEFGVEHCRSGRLGSQPRHQHRVNREQPAQGTPLGSHICDCEAVVDRDAAHGLLGAGELDGVVEDLVVVKQAAQGNDHVLSRHPRGQNTGQGDFGNGRNLPPRPAGSPDGHGICPHHGRAQAAHAAVHVAVRVGGDCDCARPGVALLNHDLVANTPASGVEVDAVLLCKLLDLPVLLEVRLALVLHIVIQGHDDLPVVVDL